MATKIMMYIHLKILMLVLENLLPFIETRTQSIIRDTIKSNASAVETMATFNIASYSKSFLK